METVADAQAFDPCIIATPIVPFTWNTFGNYVNANNRFIGTVSNFDFKIRTNNIQRMVVTKDGSVGIGTPLTHNDNSYLLAVNGLIGAKELKIEINSTTWPDYVFNKSYSLLSLNELEQYLDKNKHLPNIPSAKNVNKDNGVLVGDMQVKLLQKVEELTLYIIEMNKKTDELQVKMQLQQLQIEALQYK